MKFFEICSKYNCIIRYVSLRLKPEIWKKEFFKGMLSSLISLYSKYKVFSVEIFLDDGNNIVTQNYIKLRVKTLKIKFNNLTYEDLNNKI